MKSRWFDFSPCASSMNNAKKELERGSKVYLYCAERWEVCLVAFFVLE